MFLGTPSQEQLPKQNFEENSRKQGWKQEQNPKEGFGGQVPKQGSQARLQKTVPEQGPNEQVCLKKGSGASFRKNKFPYKVPKNRFPSKARMNKCQAMFPRTGAQARFQE